MRVMSQDKRGIVNLENQDNICIIPGDSESRPYEISSDSMGLGEYSSLKKARSVLFQIFEHKGETFIMPQDDEVEG